MGIQATNIKREKIEIDFYLPRIYQQKSTD